MRKRLGLPFNMMSHLNRLPKSLKRIDKRFARLGSRAIWTNMLVVTTPYDHESIVHHCREFGLPLFTLSPRFCDCQAGLVSYLTDSTSRAESVEGSARRKPRWEPAR